MDELVCHHSGWGEEEFVRSLLSAALAILTLLAVSGAAPATAVDAQIDPHTGDQIAQRDL